MLPNDHWIYHVNSYETDFLFNEIYIDEVYLKHDIKIPKEATIIDAGANIGLFSLWIKNKFPMSKILAFEPSPEIYKILELNMMIINNDVQAYNYGLSDKEDIREFFYYPGYSVISGFHVNRERDAEIIISGMKASSKQGSNIPGDFKRHSSMTSLVKKRFNSLIAYKCKVSTLSQVIHQTNLTNIDLLKIDVEGSELAVLGGIDENDWNKINQIVVEVHNNKDLNIIVPLLKSKHFKIIVEEDKMLKNSGIYILFAFGSPR